jgi:hypothetical protein
MYPIITCYIVGLFYVDTCNNEDFNAVSGYIRSPIASSKVMVSLVIKRLVALKVTE